MPLADPARRREYMHEYRKANLEKSAETQRRYRNANREHVREVAQRYRNAHPERVREYARRHREANKDKSYEHNRTSAHGITRIIRDWMYESQDRACAGCKTPMADENLEIDHDHGCCPGTTSCGSCVRGLVCRSCNKRDVLAGVGR